MHLVPPSSNKDNWRVLEEVSNKPSCLEQARTTTQASWKRQKPAEWRGRNTFQLVQLPASCAVSWRFPTYVSCHLRWRVLLVHFCSCKWPPPSFMGLFLIPVKVHQGGLWCSPYFGRSSAPSLGLEDICSHVPRNSATQHNKTGKHDFIVFFGMVRSVLLAIR